MWACNQSGLHTVTRTEEGCLILGFLSFKVLLYMKKLHVCSIEVAIAFKVQPCHWHKFL